MIDNTRTPDYRRWMRWGIIFALLLAGCSEKESAKLERQYEIMKSSTKGDGELCRKAKDTAEAFLKEENSHEYQMWDLKAAVHCSAEATRSLRH